MHKRIIVVLLAIAVVISFTPTFTDLIGLDSGIALARNHNGNGTDRDGSGGHHGGNNGKGPNSDRGNGRNKGGRGPGDGPGCGPGDGPGNGPGNTPSTGGGGEVSGPVGGSYNGHQGNGRLYQYNDAYVGSPECSVYEWFINGLQCPTE